MIIGKQLQSPYYFVAVVSCHVDFMGAADWPSAYPYR